MFVACSVALRASQTAFHTKGDFCGSRSASKVSGKKMRCAVDPVCANLNQSCLRDQPCRANPIRSSHLANFSMIANFE